MVLYLSDEARLSAQVETKAWLSRNGVAIASNSVLSVDAGHAQRLLLRVPSDTQYKNNNTYVLTVKGASDRNALIFEREKRLTFNPKFLTIVISTNRMVYNAEQPIRVRVVLLTHEGEAYTKTASIFFHDPEGFIVRKFSSRHLNVGVMSRVYALPLYPKVKAFF